jgi:hypothetical protein
VDGSLHRYTVNPLRDNFSIRCDVQGKIDRAFFYYPTDDRNGSLVVRETGAPFWMNGDSPKWVNRVKYLKGCGGGTKIVPVIGYVNEDKMHPCFVTTLLLEAECAPTKAPIKPPTKAPTKAPTKPPTMAPTKPPTMAPTMAPTKAPTAEPTRALTASPKIAPTIEASSAAPSSMSPSAAKLEDSSAAPTSMSPSAASLEDYEITVSYSNVPVDDHPFFQVAFDRWQSIITKGLRDIPSSLLGPPIDGCSYPEVIDDVFVCATYDLIPSDGPGNVLAFAGPIFWRTPEFLPITGGISVDSQDVERMKKSGLLDRLILHEVGHVLGRCYSRSP